ncbi:venom allergen 5-like [Schistocerca nitens]|uniref:venom allergen 5-like n=1 Tax=Schistocerca nitens TaxID=7011 RepID=UPI0021189BAA|nr:venom allergen 5-like [Schistocerca nitens]
MAKLSDKEIEQILLELYDSELSELSESEETGPETVGDTADARNEEAQWECRTSQNERDALEPEKEVSQAENEQPQDNFKWKKMPSTCLGTTVSGPDITADEKGVGSRCGDLRGNGTTQADENAIVAAHNELRNRVASGAEGRGSPGPQPSASNMNALVWDSELAHVAQRWAEQCRFGHDSCRDVARFSVGQNVFQSSTTGTPQGPQWRRAVQAWYDEVASFSRNNVNNYRFSAATGHYSQVVWAVTRYIGCGYTAFTEPGGWTSQLYVCNYGPAGNFIGQSVYITGQNCSRCVNGCHSNYTSLCA